jgi:hypothetical protein
MMTPEQIIARYDALVKRAIDITDKAPFWTFVYEEQTAKLAIKGGTATLSWCKPESGYECSCTLEIESVDFDANLLAMNAATLAEWKKAEAVKYKLKVKAEAEARGIQNERELRRQYEGLKKVFGDA